MKLDEEQVDQERLDRGLSRRSFIGSATAAIAVATVLDGRLARAERRGDIVAGNQAEPARRQIGQGSLEREGQEHLDHVM